MSNPNPKRENLDPVKSNKEARKRGKAGGIKSGKVRKEKKLLSQIYADVIATLNNKPKGQSLPDIIESIVKERKPHSVSMLKEIREATEGTKASLTLPEDITIIIKGQRSKNDTN